MIKIKTVAMANPNPAAMRSSPILYPNNLNPTNGLLKTSSNPIKKRGLNPIASLSIFINFTYKIILT